MNRQMQLSVALAAGVALAAVVMGLFLGSRAEWPSEMVDKRDIDTAAVVAMAGTGCSVPAPPAGTGPAASRACTTH